ncbi:MAG: hypothetical protein AAB628_01885 [Patescibacteria group bacterium]
MCFCGICSEEITDVDFDAHRVRLVGNEHVHQSCYDSAEFESGIVVEANDIRGQKTDTHKVANITED